MRQVIDELRDTRRLSPTLARRIASRYAEYFADVCQLDLSRLLCANATVAYSSQMLVRGTAQPRDCQIYFATSKSTRRIYFAIRDLSTAAQGTGYELGFWRQLEPFGTGEVDQLVGATIYEPVVDPAAPPVHRWLYLFAERQTLTGRTLVFLRYDLDTATWESEASPLEVPHEATDFTAWLFPTDKRRPPRLGLEITTGTGDARLVSRVSQSLNLQGTGWDGGPSPAWWLRHLGADPQWIGRRLCAHSGESRPKRGLHRDRARSNRGGAARGHLESQSAVDPQVCPAGVADLGGGATPPVRCAGGGRALCYRGWER